MSGVYDPNTTATIYYTKIEVNTTISKANYFVNIKNLMVFFGLSTLVYLSI